MARILVHFDPIKDIYHHTLDEHPDIVVVESVNNRTGEINFHLASHFALTDRWYRQPQITKVINVTHE